MFKINKLDIVDNEKVTINLVIQENYMIGTKVKDRFKTLSFDKIGNNSYVIAIHFFSNILTDIEKAELYSGIIEFDFNLDDYI